jgi:hypothetical protein
MGSIPQWDISFETVPMTSIDLAAWQTRLGLSQVEPARLLEMPVQVWV